MFKKHFCRNNMARDFIPLGEQGDQEIGKGQ
uniref:Uncharacterized protein n=1 Tax=Rhizophora mucronata TaxID=61149 RepID=A0A2P2NU14_RHIMU